MANIEDHGVDRFAPDSTALIVVDVQRAFTSTESPLADRGFDVERCGGVVEDCAGLADAARDAGLPVVFTRLLRRADGKDAPRNVFDIYPGAYEQYGDALCLDGSWGAEYAAGIDPEPDDYEIEKRNQDAFHATPLAYNLRAEGVDTVVVCGLVSNVCVEATARGAHERGFDVVLVEDCCASYDEAMHEATVHNVEYIVGATATRAQVEERLPGVEAAD